MAFFRSKRLDGVVYDPSHLEPFVFSLKVGEIDIRIEVEFGCHCFTKALLETDSPSVLYVHKGERRAFCTERFELSKALPDYFRSLGNQTVYWGNQGGFFFWRNAAGAPYLIFFKTMKLANRDADVRVEVRSAHLKPGMTQFAQPVKFSTVIEATASGRKLPRGDRVKIKRK